MRIESGDGYLFPLNRRFKGMPARIENIGGGRIREQVEFGKRCISAYLRAIGRWLNVERQGERVRAAKATPGNSSHNKRAPGGSAESA